jgi:hypothetical protein
MSKEDASSADEELPQQAFPVELYGGGEIYLQSADEMARWEALAKRYAEDYQLTKGNDLAFLDLVLQQHILAYRAQNLLNGMVPELDDEKLPTGRYMHKPPTPAQTEKAQKSMTDASKEIRALEKVLGIDRAARESQGGHTIDSYLTTLKGAANEFGVHISNRLKAYEQFVNDLRWRVRLNENGDEEDKRYHDVEMDGIMRWTREELGRLEQIDKDFAHEKQKLWLGKL